MKLWGRNREPEPEGATIDWSPVREMTEDPAVAKIMIEHRLDSLDESDRAYALELLELRERIDGSVAAWGRELEARLDDWAPGWRDDMPTVEWDYRQMALVA